MSHSLLLLNAKGINFYKIWQYEKMESCRVLNKIIDFTFDNSAPSMIYALTDKQEVVLFELSSQRNKCTALGKISLD